MTSIQVPNRNGWDFFYVRKRSPNTVSVGDVLIRLHPTPLPSGALMQDHCEVVQVMPEVIALWLERPAVPCDGIVLAGDQLREARTL